MRLFKSNKGELKAIERQDFLLEKHIQSLIEANLEELFNLVLVKSEFEIHKYRLDTLAFDLENNAFVIIEYKKTRNFSVIDQGYAYMSLMLNNKADFILEYNENQAGTLSRKDIDWSQSRVIFIAPEFTEYQKDSINFKDVPFELWQIHKYEGDLIGLTEHNSSSKESITSINTNSQEIVDKVNKEIKVYSEEEHVNQSKVNEETRELYYELKSRILHLGPDIELKAKKMYVAYSVKRNFLSITFLSNQLWCWLNFKKGELDDPKGITRDVSEIGHYGNGDYELRIDKDADMEYVMFLIKQAYKKHK